MRLAMAVVAAMLLVSACSNKYRVDTIDKPSAALSRQASFYVILPVDGAYGDTKYEGSGATTAQAVSAALLHYVDRADIGQVAGESVPDAIAHAKAQGAGYVFQPVILHWEDRATEWSGITDKVEFKFSVFDAATGQPVSSTVTHASTKWGSLGGDHPQDLLPETTKDYVDQLFN